MPEFSPKPFTALFAMSLLACSSVHAGTLHSAIIPTIETDEARQSQSYFAMLINDTDSMAKNCRIEIDEEHRLSLSFYTTDQTNNSLTGARNSPADVWPRASQAFFLELTATSRPDRITGAIYPTFVCDGLDPAIQVKGTNDIQLESFSFSALMALTDRELEIMPEMMEKLENLQGAEPSVLSAEEMALILKLQSHAR